MYICEDIVLIFSSGFSKSGDAKPCLSPLAATGT